MRMTRTLPIVALAALGALLGACGDPKVTVHEGNDFAFDGTCVRCHAGLHSGQVHPTFKLRCIDCHGGNDQVFDVPENAATLGESIFRDQDLVARSHVKPKVADLARFFFANGIDDDGDGQVDEDLQFMDANSNGKLDPGEIVTDPGELPELGLQGEAVGQFIDAELNRDLNYTRWLNPGDLRVATLSCGASSAQAGGGGGCHQDVVNASRRSIMSTNGGVINGAYYGNESWRAKFFEARDAMTPATDPRQGAFGYTFAWDAADACIDQTAVTADDLRGQPVFDSACLEASTVANDPNAASGAPGNTGLPGEVLPNMEIAQGTITPAPELEGKPRTTIAHKGAKNGRYPWGGQTLGDDTHPLEQMQPVPDDPFDLANVFPDPVDNVLRGFRAYYPLNFPGSGNNFVFSFGESIEPNIDRFVFNNPFGRGHSSGCTGCHMAYDNTGARKPQQVTTYNADGTTTTTAVVDPTTKHREFDPATQDLQEIGGEDRIVGVAVNKGERDTTGREQQRYYSESHTLTTKITTQTCGMCHSFVTRIDHSYRGFAEDEQRDAVARRAPLRFTTQRGTQVNILSSHIFEDATKTPRLQPAPGQAIVELAKKRDADLAALGLFPNHGGCVQDVFTEDCNNNGELDDQLTLERRYASGKVIASVTIGEDLNGNGQLDLIDRVPREKSVDGRQFKYIYGGANGSTRLMDIHFEKGMHCIDCHFLQDTHGDGNVYSTNWETIEIECEDCHGTKGQKATLFTSGQNGGNDLRKARDANGIPYFLKMPDGSVFQRSRVEDGLAWKIPQVDDVITPGTPEFNPRAVPAMGEAAHMPDPVPAGSHTTGSTFDKNGKLKDAKLECYACHNSWVYNCMGCHYQMNSGDTVRAKLAADGSVSAVAGENEVWYDNKNETAKTDFQLLALQRGPFVLGVNAAADGHRLAPFRSSMEAHVSVNDTAGNTVLDNVTFTTFQAKDGNSGRENVATSAVAMNQTMPHSVRRSETKDCDWCHAVVDQAGRMKNDSILAQTYGIGAGRYPYTGDWILTAGAKGLELFDIKKERELKGARGANRFPGLIVSNQAADVVPAKVEPSLAVLGLVGFTGTDVALVRNFNPAPATVGAVAPPTLRDLALYTMASATDGKLVISDLSGRGVPGTVPPSAGDAAARFFVLDLPARAEALATISPDLSDPFVYVANGTAGLSTVTLRAAPAAGVTAAELSDTRAIAGGTATAVALAGDVVYVGTAEGDVVVFDASSPDAPVEGTRVAVGGAVKAMSATGFFLYIATDAGLAVLDLNDPANPARAAGAASVQVLAVAGLNGLYVSAGHAYLAAGAKVLDVDVSIAAAPVELGDLVPAGEPMNAQDVVVSVVPGQTWVIVADATGTGSIAAIKLDNRLNQRERCLPDPIAAGCGTDFNWRDPDIMGRDPSFDPATQTFDADDPSAPFLLRYLAVVGGAPRRLARPALWEKIGTQTGRRMRDSFMPGSGVLSLEVMQKMRGVQLCEAAGTGDIDGNGLEELGPADDAFKATGTCVPFTATASGKPKSTK
jgi:hypothetical protein